MQTLFLRIANFDIKLQFHSVTNTFKDKNVFIKTFTNQLKSFISKDEPSSIHATITFRDKPIYTILYGTKNNAFLEFFTVKNQIHYNSFYHISSYQFYSLLSHILTMLFTKRGGIMIHASAALVRGKVVLFLGNSSAGKSTIIKLLKNKYPILADDHVIIRKKGAKYVAYQTPYPEREDWFSKNSHPLPIGKVYFLKKGLSVSERILQNHEKLTYLLENVPLPEVEKSFYIKFIMSFIAKQNNFYEFTFPKNRIKLEYYFEQIYK